ncbi:tyrosine-type recombinase/integrase [Nocardia vinacea]|uniref:tyrosine-type recombinase/integrase n=1 Tax=Nocardia vinacea TaxID=96468 RepID=UPI001C3F2B50|nr:site-specific integrase [Nocardia vinacea]
MASEVVEGDTRLAGRLSTAMQHAYCLRLIQPTQRVLRASRLVWYTTWFRQCANDPLLEEFCQRMQQWPVNEATQRRAVLEVCLMLTVYGIDLSGLTAEAVVHHAAQSTHDRIRVAAAWPVLHGMGRFPEWVPTTLRYARVDGQQSVEELVDRHQLRNQDVRGLLVQYLRRRSVGVDYSTLTNLARSLVADFWKIVEDINPDQADLRLDERTVAEWKKRTLLRLDGKPRIQLNGPFLAVRALYLDLQAWAAAEPHRWSLWVAPCLIREADALWQAKSRRRLAERMADRTRERQLLLPILSEHVTTRWQWLRALLAQAQNVGLGETFVLEGVTWQCTATRHDQRQIGRPAETIRLINRDSGELLRASQEEEQAFWQWACVETLRLAGIRREELVELTHLSLRQYQRPNGEVVALLVISPSKSDRERVLPMSGELFHVIAQVIRRQVAEYGSVPVCPRFDEAERRWCEPLPYLFQRRLNGTPHAMATSTVADLVRKAARHLVPTHPEFADITFAPHDFRRLFATDLVNNGLPIHIGAALLGHLNIQTTRGYVAVFEENVVRHYQEFLERRRAYRPSEDYRAPTPDEWSDFQEHFDKRRVELGSCGRPYGTGCQHEHACIRCQMLSVNPKMLPRLDEIEEDLLARRRRALEEGWRGEIEGIDLTLTFLRSKRTRTQNTAANPVSLGLPSLNLAAGR